MQGRVGKKKKIGGGNQGKVKKSLFYGKVGGCSK
jgi:hypothetical protein